MSWICSDFKISLIPYRSKYADLVEEQLYFSAAGWPGNISQYRSPSFSALEKCSVSIISAFKACITGVKTSAPPWVCATRNLFWISLSLRSLLVQLICLNETLFCKSVVSFMIMWRTVEITSADLLFLLYALYFWMIYLPILLKNVIISPGGAIKGV